LGEWKLCSSTTIFELVNKYPLLIRKYLAAIITSVTH
jgi:hypothetical protein